jgi:hypothetical protein
MHSYVPGGTSSGRAGDESVLLARRGFRQPILPCCTTAEPGHLLATVAIGPGFGGQRRLSTCRTKEIPLCRVPLRVTSYYGPLPVR